MISTVVLWAVYGPAVALSSENDQLFLGMINKIREKPYNYAIDLKCEGCDPDSLEAKGIGPNTTFAPYTLDTNLTTMAENESQLMACEDIPVSETPPSPPVHRLTASTGGVVSFFNFMPRDTAFKIVIDYLVKKELDPNNESPRYILSPKTYSSVGIAISAGKVGSGNAWFVSICLGSPELVSEIQMLNLINQVRVNPKNIWKYNVTHEKVDDWEQLAELIYGEYKPLFFDASLSSSAQAHSSYVLNGIYPEEALSETQTALERAKYYEYEGEVVQEIELYFPIKEDDSFFSLWKEIEKVSPLCSAVVFSKDFQDVGSNIAFQSGGEIHDSVLSFVVGRKDQNTSNDGNDSSNTDHSSRIYGILFSDNNRNDLYDPGEELIQQTVKVYVDDEQEIQSVVTTDNAGHFSRRLKANHQYNFIATIEGVPGIEDVSITWKGNEDGDKTITSDQFVKLFYTPPSLENDPPEEACLE